MQVRPKLLFVVSEDWYFWSHRLPLALTARNADFDVVLATHITELKDAIEAAGVRVLPLDIRRSSMNPIEGLKLLITLIDLYKRERPDIVHHVAMKPVLCGSIAARLAGVRAVVNALAGLGFVFVSSSAKARLLRPPMRGALRWALNRSGSVLILQNPEDLDQFVSGGLIARERACLIRGSGVDTVQFRCAPEPGGIPIVVLPARMLWDKGVGEFINAARRLRARGVEGRFVLVGEPDQANPSAISKDQLDAWQREGIVEWWGHRPDMSMVLTCSHIVCLPSYGEGLPKVLLEGAACGRPLVATNVRGCREIVRDGDNGLLVPVRDVEALAGAIERLITNRALRKRMGARGREIVEAEFTDKLVANQTLKIYRKLLA